MFVKFGAVTERPRTFLDEIVLRSRANSQRRARNVCRGRTLQEDLAAKELTVARSCQASCTSWHVFAVSATFRRRCSSFFLCSTVNGTESGGFVTQGEDRELIRGTVTDTSAEVPPCKMF